MEPRGFFRVAAGFSSYDVDFSLPLGLALGSPIFPSGCEGKLGVALESMISACFQGKPFNTTEIQVYTPTSNVEEADVERFYEDVQDLIDHQGSPQAPLLRKPPTQDAILRRPPPSSHLAR